MKNCYSMFKCSDGTLICGLKDENGIAYLSSFEFSNNELILIQEKKINYEYIVIINQLKNGNIITGSYRSLIQIWD